MLGEHRFEDDDAGECSDCADHDRDGFFDCVDNDCAFGPDCMDTGPGQYASLSVEHSLTWGFDEARSFHGLENCVQSHTGAGAALFVADGAEAFTGTWEKVSDD